MPPQSPTTSFFTSTSSPAPTSTDGNGGSRGITSPIGSPPLILAFLAVGMFAAAMIAVFGWRRIQFPTGFMAAGPGHEVGESIFPMSDDLRRPIMWEVWTNQVGNVDKYPNAESYGFWENINPLAALPASKADKCPKTRPNRTSSTTRTDSLSTLSNSGSNSNRTQRPFPNTFARLDFIRLRTRDQSQENEPNAPKPESGGPLSLFANGAGEMQIAVVIEMPSPAASERRRRQEEREQEQDALFDDVGGVLQYCVGTHACPWPPKPQIHGGM